MPRDTSAATFPRRGRRASPRARGRRVRRRCRASRQRRRPAPPPGEAPCALRVPGSAPTTACPLGTAAWTPWGGIKHVPTLVQSSPRPPTELATLQSEAPPPPGPRPRPPPSCRCLGRLGPCVGGAVPCVLLGQACLPQRDALRDPRVAAGGRTAFRPKATTVRGPCVSQALCPCFAFKTSGRGCSQVPGRKRGLS